MHLEVEIEEQQEDSGVKDGVEEPRADAIAAAFDEMEEENSDVAEEVTAEEDNLAIDDEWEARAGEPNRGPETVPVNHGINRGC